MAAIIVTKSSMYIVNPKGSECVSQDGNTILS